MFRNSAVTAAVEAVVGKLLKTVAGLDKQRDSLEHQLAAKVCSGVWDFSFILPIDYQQCSRFRNSADICC